MRPVTVDEILARSTQHNLPSDADLGIFLETDGGLFFISVIKDNGNAGLGNSSLPTLVY